MYSWAYQPKPVPGLACRNDCSESRDLCGDSYRSRPRRSSSSRTNSYAGRNVFALASTARAGLGRVFVMPPSDEKPC